ncbi:MAG: FliA/WhiG family RNA polymerase sigma factor, partial [Candidatus Rokubacteria bacterium]|nr:FliA/WhiG family RNA polymerase sigma factor [Candidatus Rokubacteria bacterium]
YIYLVRYVAGRMAARLPSHVDLGDLTSAGLMGFLTSMDAYDPDREVDFPTYALNRIRGAILDELRGLDWAPRFLRKKARAVERALADLEQTFKRPPTDAEVAAHLQVSVPDYREMLSQVSGATLLSLDEGWNEGGSDGSGASRHTVRDPAEPDPFTHLAVKERRSILGRLIEGLPEQERTVLALYYYDELTMKEIGRALDISESRVSQIHAAAVLRLRARLRRHRLEAQDLAIEDAGPPTSTRSSGRGSS